jgi:hypothetical protein
MNTRAPTKDNLSVGQNGINDIIERLNDQQNTTIKRLDD